jgi:hypothetical protein
MNVFIISSYYQENSMQVEPLIAVNTNVYNELSFICEKYFYKVIAKCLRY